MLDVERIIVGDGIKVEGGKRQNTGMFFRQPFRSLFPGNQFVFVLRSDGVEIVDLYNINGIGMA